ncbi:hypothetical protein EJB05_06824, partial [Eragrostis curvula]
MDPRRPACGVPAVRVASRLQLATYFTSASPSPSPSSRRGGRHGCIGPPPALTADVRVVIRRHFPVHGPGGTRIVEKVAEDIALRQRPSRLLRAPENVDRALAKDVLPLVRHPFDRGAMVTAGKEICAHVAAACADARIAHGGAHVLVLIDTFACPVVFRRPPPGKPMQRVVRAPPKTLVVVKNADRCMDVEDTVPADQLKPVGVIGDKRPKPAAAEEEMFKGWVPW